MLLIVRILGKDSMQLHQVRLIAFQEPAEFIKVTRALLLHGFMRIHVLVADGKFHVCTCRVGSYGGGRRRWWFRTASYAQHNNCDGPSANRRSRNRFDIAAPLLLLCNGRFWCFQNAAKTHNSNVRLSAGAQTPRRPGTCSHWPCRLVVLRLGRLRLSLAASKRLSRSHLSRAILRHHRDQHVLLSAAPARPCETMARTRLRQSSLRLHRQALAEIHP